MSADASLLEIIVGVLIWVCGYFLGWVNGYAESGTCRNCGRNKP